MTVSIDILQTWMNTREDEHLEFKEAKKNFHFETLVKYCVALANEGGGRMILGVTDKLPREVVGTQVFPDLEKTKAGLIERLRLRMDVEEIQHPNGRVLVFQVPSRPIGMPMQYKGAYWMRGGEDLIPMTPDLLQRIFAESGPDFSAEISTSALLEDLDSNAVEVLRRLWQSKTPDQDISTRPIEQLLSDAELVVDGLVTYAALILLGKREALGKYLAQSEVIFEYRSNEAPGPAAERHEFRQGFLSALDEIWRLINLRNDRQSFQQGLFVWDVPTFNERVVREAVLNAVSHRDYRHGGSVFIRQYPRRIEIVSPGGFPPGITPDNILRQQNPRNRRIAEAPWQMRIGRTRRDKGLTASSASAFSRASHCLTFSHTDALLCMAHAARGDSRPGVSAFSGRDWSRTESPHSVSTIFWWSISSTASSLFPTTYSQGLIICWNRESLSAWDAGEACGSCSPDNFIGTSVRRELTHASADWTARRTRRCY